jgi:uncharacterized protein (DUF305 family)
MRIHRAAAVRVAAAVALAVAVSAPASFGAAGPRDPVVAQVAVLHGKSFDVAFLQAAIPVDDEAAELASTATLYADHPDLLHWNQDYMEREHKQVQEMLTWLSDLGAQPGQRYDGVDTASVKRLRTLRGAALERTYISLMIQHLDRTAALANLAATHADRPELRAFAAGEGAADARDAAMLRGWVQAWYH